MGNLLKLSYWFNLDPGPWLDDSLRIMYGLFGLLFLFGLVVWWLENRYKADRLVCRFWQMLRRACLSIGFVGLFLIVARQQRIYFLGMPLLLLLLLAGVGVWVYFILKYLFKTMPNKRQEEEKRKIKDKYLP